METILHDFNEIVISLVTEYLKKLISEGGLSDFTDDLNKQMMEFGNKITGHLIDYAENIIFKLKERKKEFESLEIDDRTIITIFGAINFKRRYYLDKETGKRVYLLDEYLGLEPSQRMLANVKEKLIKEAVESSYQKAGKQAAYGIEISKQTVMNEIESLELTNEVPEKEKKKKVRTLYIIADEDHVHLQKGGIEEPRVVIVYDSLVSIGKRIELKNKKHFGGVYTKKIDDLWEEVATYIENTYDTDFLEIVYISGDRS